MQSIESQLKVAEKTVEQMSLEKAKLQMRLEQLENPSFFHEIKDEIERT
jgi:hypothetical protein